MPGTSQYNSYFFYKLIFDPFNKDPSSPYLIVGLWLWFNIRITLSDVMNCKDVSTFFHYFFNLNAFQGKWWRYTFIPYKLILFDAYLQRKHTIMTLILMNLSSNIIFIFWSILKDDYNLLSFVEIRGLNVNNKQKKEWNFYEEKRKHRFFCWIFMIVRFVLQNDDWTCWWDVDQIIEVYSDRSEYSWLFQGWNNHKKI